MIGLMRSLITTKAMVVGRRTIVTTSPLRDSRSLIKLKQLQCQYQAEDGRPIFLKAGFRDRILYTLTLVLCAIGLGGVFELIYQKAKPASWNNPAC